jgi:hypothetical protein
MINSKRYGPEQHEFTANTSRTEKQTSIELAEYEGL